MLDLGPIKARSKQSLSTKALAYHARDDIPALVAEVEALREALIKFANIATLHIQSDFKRITDALIDWSHDAPPTT